jgi:hypothetical protein
MEGLWGGAARGALFFAFAAARAPVGAARKTQHDKDDERGGKRGGGYACDEGHCFTAFSM